MEFSFMIVLKFNKKGFKLVLMNSMVEGPTGLQDLME